MSEDKRFIVKATGVISGIVDKFSSDQIIEKIKSTIDESVGEIEMWCEALGDDDGVETVFAEEPFEFEVEELKIVYDRTPSCEHCGENHSDYDATIFYGGLSWCPNCFEANEEIPKKILKEILNEIKPKLEEFEIEYHEKRLKELKAKMKKRKK